MPSTAPGTTPTTGTFCAAPGRFPRYGRASDAGGQPETVRKTHEELGVRLFTPARKGFDPITASFGELLRFGYPDRPDPQLHPQLHVRWEQMMSAPVSMIEPRFVVPRPVEPVPGPVQVGTSPYPATATSANWSGSVMYPADLDGVAVVAGQWTVPQVAEPQFGPPPMRVPPGSGSTAILGIRPVLCLVTSSRPGPHKKWGGSPSPGGSGGKTRSKSTVSRFRRAMSSTACSAWTPRGQVSFYLLNRTSQALVSFAKTAPSAGEQVAGGAVGWILEKPVGAGTIPD